MNPSTPCDVACHVLCCSVDCACTCHTEETSACHH
jgi:hypothetical protein